MGEPSGMGTEGSALKIAIGIAHHVRVYREGLAAVLEAVPDLCVTPISHESGALQRKVPQLRLDLALLDASADVESLETRIQDVKRRFCDPKVIVLGVTNSTSAILACIEAGAAGYTLEDGSKANLVETIRNVHQGGMPCPPEVSALLFERLASFKRELGPPQDPKLKSFTRRETQILQLVADDLSNKEIAAYLGLELQTVKNYVHNILEKLRVQNRRDAAAFARNCGLVESGPR